MLRNGVNIKNDFEVKRGAESEIVKEYYRHDFPFGSPIDFNFLLYPP